MQAIRSLMVQEKQMPPSVSLVFLLDSLYLKKGITITMEKVRVFVL